MFVYNLFLSQLSALHGHWALQHLSVSSRILLPRQQHDLQPLVPVIACVLFCQFFGLKPIFLHRYHLTLHIAMGITSGDRESFSVAHHWLAQTVKSWPSMQETRVQSLGQEDSLEKGMATHSSILAWRIPWTERGAWRATVHGVTKSQIWLSD